VVCSILRDELKAEVCFYNSGGLRGNLTYYGPMTYSDFVNEIPFPNNMLVVDMLGVELQEVARYSEARKGISWGGYLQWDDGVRMDSEGRLELLAGEEAELDRVYRVAVWGGLLDGYDDFTVLRGVGERHAHQCGSSLDALIEDGARHGTSLHMASCWMVLVCLGSRFLRLADLGAVSVPESRGPAEDTSVEAPVPAQNRSMG